VYPVKTNRSTHFQTNMKSLFRQTRTFFGGRAKQQATSTKLYDALGVNQQATEDEIKKAFKSLALKHHPDRGGDADKFKEIAQAYEVLSNPEKRQAYDSFGEEGLNSQSQGQNPNDIFEQMFGRRSRVMRTPDITHRIEISLEDIFTGIQRSVRFTRDLVCKTCQGKGATKTDACKRCGGSGTILTRQNVGFMVAMQSACPDCAGQGFRVPPGCSCPVCAGNGKVEEKETFELRIPRGCENRQKFLFPGKGDELPGHVPGDVVIEVVEKTHAKFLRVGNDLHVKQKVGLIDALAGVKFEHKHLDGKTVSIAGAPNEVVKPGTIWKVPGLGMNPIGSLFVSFDVLFPESVQGNEALMNLVAAVKRPTTEGCMQGKRLTEAEVREVGKKRETSRKTEDAEERQCAQQ